MNQAIWKFPIGDQALACADDIQLHIPQGATVLTCMEQQGEPCIWMKVDPEAQTETRYFKLFATGQKFDDRGLHYVGTYQLKGYYMFHLFEVKY